MRTPRARRRSFPFKTKDQIRDGRREMLYQLVSCATTHRRIRYCVSSCGSTAKAAFSISFSFWGLSVFPFSLFSLRLGLRI